MRTVLLVSIVLVLQFWPSIPNRSGTQAPFGCGVVTGRVLDDSNHPVAGVTVYSLITDRPPRGRISSAMTDDQGTFTLTCAEIGRNSIHVAKVDDGYPDTLLTPFMDAKSIVVVDVKHERPSTLDVRLPPRAGRLSGRLVDAATKKSIEGAVVTLCRAESPYDCHPMNANQTATGFSYLIPPVPFTVRASAPGHMNHVERDSKGRPNVIRIAPGTTKTLNLTLEATVR